MNNFIVSNRFSLENFVPLLVQVFHFILIIEERKEFNSLQLNCNYKYYNG